MGHGITETDQVFSVREPMWHGLGLILEDAPDRAEAQELITPWEPIEMPVYRQVPYFDGEGQPQVRYEEIAGSKSVERSDNGHLLGVVNESFTLVTNNDLWDVAEAVINSAPGGEVLIETGGTLEGGKNVWVLLKMAEPFVVKGDPNGHTLAHLAIQNGHTGMRSFRGQAVNTRIVCANTSAAADTEAKANGYEFTFKHSKNVQERIEEAKAAVALWYEGVNQWKHAMEHLATVEVTPEGVKWFVEQFQPMPPERLISDRVRGNVERARGELTSILRSETSEGIDKTAYGLVQAGIEWRQHFQATKGKDERSRMENRFKRAMLSTDRFGADVIALAQEAALV